MLIGASVMPMAILAPLVPTAALAIGATCFLTFGHALWATNLQTLPPDLFKSGEIGTVTGFSGMGGALGGFTTAKKEVIELLRQRSRPYLFSNSLPPHVVAAGIKAFDMLSSAGEMREQLKDNTRYFREKMTAAGFDIRPGVHPISPVMLYDAPLAQRFAERLLEEGIYAIGFFFPVVAKGQARIRTQISAAHTREHLDRAISVFTRIGVELGVIRQ
jgi:glycine C-acetyltransferase